MKHLTVVLGHLVAGLSLLMGCTASMADQPTAPIIPSTDSAQDAATSAPDAATPDVHVPLARPYALHVPRGRDSSRPAPLVIALHGYAGSGASAESYFSLGTLADEEGFLYALPDGALDQQGHRAWNISDGCCHEYIPEVGDDVAYISALIDDVQARHRVDPKRIYVVGYSNGGGLAYRLACSLSKLAGIVSVAGPMWAAPTNCEGEPGTSVLTIHGTADAVIPYDGGRIANQSGLETRSAPETAAFWATKNDCSARPTVTPARDLVDSLPGNETKGLAYNCTSVGVDLWTIDGGSHSSKLRSALAREIYDFLSAHPKRP